ncbi:MAG: hypothetical protein FWD71_21260 [Oscillospiraceae bacterium]|nr:hypothetical protein [Oscillospiraceae bacterium]
MGVFLLCIPLIIFIAVEGVIIYELIKIISAALTEYGFENSTVIGNVYPSGTAILLVLGLVVVVAVMIWVYIRFAIISTVRDKKKGIYANEKPRSSANSGSGKDYIDYVDYIESIDDTNLDNYANTRKKSKIKAKKNKNKKQ